MPRLRAANVKKLSNGIISWPVDERPRERLLSRGPHSLTDAELIAILVRVGFQGTNAVELGRNLMKQFGSLRAMAEAPLSAMFDVKGLKGAKVAQLAAAMEIARRVSLPDGKKRIQIKGTAQAGEYVKERLRGLPDEHFWVLYLNRQNRLLDDVLIAQGDVELRRGDKTIFFGPDCEASVPDDQVEFFKEVLDPDGDFRGGREAIENSHDFKTPLDLVIADAKPERKFVRLLCERENAQAIDAYIKNTPQRFYPIEYAWKKGEHPKRGEFSPDFFIKKGGMIFVVEIKGDEEVADPSPENIKKNEYALAHFERLNEWLAREKHSVRYQFNFLTPKDYNRFFQQIRNNDLKGFRSELDVALKRVSDDI